MTTEHRSQVEELLQAQIDRRRREHEELMKEIPAVAEWLVNEVAEGRIKVPSLNAMTRTVIGLSRSKTS